jgi:hypothetical protein
MFSNDNVDFKMGNFETKKKQELKSTDVFQEHFDFFKDKEPCLLNHTNLIVLYM